MKFLDRFRKDTTAQTGTTIGGASLMTVGVGLAVAGANLATTNLTGGLATAGIGLALLFAGIYITSKGIVTEAVALAKKAKH